MSDTPPEEEQDVAEQEAPEDSRFVWDGGGLEWKKP